MSGGLPEQLGRYRVLHKLGEGGGGSVWDAELPGPGGLVLPVAIKVLHDGGGALRREARIGGLLRHQNLVDVYEVGEDGGRWFCAMERCGGGAITRYLPLPPAAVVEVGLQVCAALAYAHEELGLVHLDLKPDNLLLADGVVKVADLGIAYAAGFAREPGRIAGTLGYMAPEQARGLPVDARADIYALGVTLVQLATGRGQEASATLSWGQFTGQDLTVTAIHDGFDPSPTLVGVPDWLAPVVARCLAEHPDDRYPDMDALAADLRALEVGGAGLREAIGWAPAPTPATPSRPPLVGRDTALARVSALLDEVGLVTIKGAPGMGKSHLADAVRHGWAGPVWWVSLAEARSPEDLWVLVATALGLDIPSVEQLDTRIGHALAGRDGGLLVLDTFEHLRDAAAVLGRWRTVAPHVGVLVTSQLALGVAGEAVVQLGPLTAAAAVDLLIAHAGRRGVDLDRDDPALGELAARLGHLPLALELAAGRLGVLTIGDVLARLDLSLLRRGTDERAGALQEALQWSWDLLRPGDRLAMAQLSCFAGGFTLPAAEAVCTVEGPVVDAVTRLVAHSLVHVAPSSSEGRFTLLGAVREFAAAHLDAEARAAVHGRHAEWFARLGHPATLAGLRHHGGTARRLALVSERDNLLAAMERAADARLHAVAPLLHAAWAVLELQGPYEVAASLCDRAAGVPLPPADAVRVRLIRARVLRLLARGEEARVELDAVRSWAATHDPALLAEAEHELGTLWSDQAAAGAAREVLERALALAIEVDDRWLQASALVKLGILDHRDGATARAVERYERGLALYLREGCERGEAVTRAHLASVLGHVDRVGEATAHARAALALHEASGDRRGQAAATAALAALQFDAGDTDAVGDLLERVLHLYLTLGDRRAASVAHVNVGVLRLEQGRTQEAVDHLEAGRAMAMETGDPRAQAAALLNGAHAWRRLGDKGLAITRATEALERYAALGNHHFQTHTHGLLSGIHLDLGHLDDAVHHARAAVEHADGLGPRARLPAHQALALALVEAGRLDDAEATLATALGIATSESLRIHRTAILALDAEVAWRRGDPARALSRLAEAEATCPEGRASGEAALTRARRILGASRSP